MEDGEKKELELWKKKGEVVDEEKRGMGKKIEDRDRDIEGYEKNNNPSQIVDYFFSTYLNENSENEKIDFLKSKNLPYPDWLV